MNRFPWNTTEDIASQDDTRYETPGGAQAKADKAEQDAKDYTDERLSLPELPIANGSIVERHYRTESVSSRALAQKAVQRRHLETGVVGWAELDPSLLADIDDVIINANFERIDEQLAEKAEQIADLNADVEVKASKSELLAGLAPKADQSYVDTQFANIVSGSPKGTYTTLAALQAAFPTGTEGTFLVLADGNWYYWNGSTWLSGGVYQGTGIADGVVTLPKLADDIRVNVAEGLTNVKATEVSKLSISDCVLYHGTASLNPSTKTLSATRNDDESACGMPILLPKAKDITFQIVTGNWVVLAINSNSSDWVCISLGASDIGRVAIIGTVWYTVIQEQNTLWTGIVPPGQNDFMRITVTDSQTYKFMVKREGEAVFKELFVLKKSQIPAITLWDDNSTLGFTKFIEVEGTQDLVKNVSWAGSGLARDVFENAVRTTTNENSLGLLRSDVESLMGGILGSRLRWKDAKWNVIGDSITASYQYQILVKELLGIATVNTYGVSGSSLASSDESDNWSFAYRAANIDVTADLVTVFGGTNDWGNESGKPLGVMGDTQPTTVYGAINSIITTVLTNNPKAKLVFITPLQRNYTSAGTLAGWSETTENSLGVKLPQIVDAIIAVCGKYGVPVLDLYRKSGITDLNKTQWLSDGLHPNAEGYAMISKQIASFLNAL